MGCDASSRAGQCPPAPRPAGLNLDGGPHQYPLPGSAAASALQEVWVNFLPNRVRQSH